MIQVISGKITHQDLKDVKRYNQHTFTSNKSVSGNKKLAQPDAELLKAYYLNSTHSNSLNFTGSRHYDYTESPLRIYDREGNITSEEALKIASLIEGYSCPTEEIQLLGQGFLGQCFKIQLSPLPTSESKVVAVKVAKPYSEIKQLSHRDTSFHNESKNLSYIPQSIENAQHLISRFKLNGKYYLVSDLKQGIPLNKLQERLKPKQLESLIETLEGLDKSGLINYDLNPGSIIIDNDRVGIIDFEFSEKFDPLKQMGRHLNDLYNISSNLAFLRKSNISSFEIRSLAEYLDKIAETKGQKIARESLKDYLKALSKYNANMAKFYQDYYDKMPDSNYGYGYGYESYRNYDDSLSSYKVSRAIELEKTLHNIFSNPSPEIIDIEMLRIKIKYTMIDYYLSKDRLGTKDEKPGDREKYGSEQKVHEKVIPMIIEIYNKLEQLYSRYDSLASENDRIDGYTKVDIKEYFENYMNYLFTFAKQELHYDLNKLRNNFSSSKIAS